jgi:hypothetical protein
MSSIEETTLKITHDAGFFSCCSVGLHFIVNFFNENKMLPTDVDRSSQFNQYKENHDQDLSKLFYNKNHFDIKYQNCIDFFWEKQFEKYSELDFNNLTLFIQRYYAVSDLILNKVFEIQQRIGVDYENIIAVCYRGNDKCSETQIGSYETYIEQIDMVYEKMDDPLIFIQTDEVEFLEKIQEKYVNVFYLDEIPIIKKNTSLSIQHTISNYKKEKFEFALNFLASMIFMSKCNHLITHSGNVGLWIAMYRGHFNNSFQYLKGEWV